MQSPAEGFEIVRWESVSKVFEGSGGVVGLHATDLSLRTHDFISITGPSGAGKSTLLNLLGLLDRPTEGRMFFHGQTVEGMSESRRAHVRSRDIAFVFQAFHLLENRSVLENVALALTYRGVRRKDREAMAADGIERFGLTHRIGAAAAVLSGGERQRVALARAVVGRPSLLLCDEPTGNLDSRNGIQVLDMLAEINAGGTCVVVVTHDPVAAGRARTHWWLEAGRLHG